MTSTPTNDVIRDGIDDRRSLIWGQFSVVGQNLYNPLSIDSPSSFPPSILYNIKNLISIYKMYVTLKLDDNRCCRIPSVPDDGNGWIVTNKRYVVMPWKMVTRDGKNMTLTETVDKILSHQESKNKELERRNIEKQKIEKKHKEYYEAHMKEEMERLNKLVDWYKFKLDKIRETRVDSRPRKLEKLY